MNNKVVTIVGQGYVGLPLAQAAASAGWKVHGYDLSSTVVDSLNQGNSHIDDLSDAEIASMINSGYTATTDPAVIRESEVVVVCVPTPLGEANSPDLRAVESSMQTIGSNLREGTLVILESTTYPGTTNEVCAPILERESGLTVGESFQLAYSPERVDPGSTEFGIKNTPKLVGGVSPESTKLATAFYQEFVDVVVPLSGAKEAETAKLLENTFRHVNIALVNEMAKFCHELDIDIWEVIRGAATKPFGFMKFTPGPGVGGHCIPIDPNYLSFEVRRRLGYPFRFVELAQEVNNSMPDYVASRTAGILNEDAKPVNGANVLLLGVTYKANIADQRESPAIPVAQALMNRHANVLFHDAFVDEWRVGDQTFRCVSDLDDAVEAADIVILLQNHTSYDLTSIATRAKRLLDTRGGAPEPAILL